MYKMRGLLVKKEKYAKQKNRGSATVEMCFIMPIIVIITAALIFLFIYAINYGHDQGKSYVSLYAYQGGDNGEITVLDGNISRVCEAERSVYGIDRETRTYSTEYGVRTDRLRRWQLYGDVLQEQGTE